MANALKCDRCKNYYDDYKVKVKDSCGHWDRVDKIKLGDSFNNFFCLDICPKCMKEFFEFFPIPDEMFDFGGER